MEPTGDLARDREQQHSLVLTDVLTQAIQEYADAVAAHALLAEGYAGAREDATDVEEARSRLRSLLALIPPMTAADGARISLVFPDGLAPTTDYARLFAGTPDGVFVADPEGRLRDANPVACQLVGYDRRELLTMRGADLTTPGDAWFASVGAAYLAEGQWRGEIDLIHKDGSRIPVEAWSLNIVSPNGPRLLSFVRDLRASKAAEAERAATLLGAREILERMGEGYCAMNRAWRITYVNREACRLLDRSPESLVGRSVWEEFPAAVNSPFYAGSQRAMREGVVTQLELDFPQRQTRLAARAYPTPGGLAFFHEMRGLSPTAE